MKMTSTIALGILAVLMLQTKVVFLHRTLVEAEMDLFTEAEKELEQDEAETELEPAEVEKELEQDEAETEPLTWAMEAAEAEHKHHPLCTRPSCPRGSLFVKPCKCITTKRRPSTCPRGFKPATLPNGTCICERITKPICRGKVDLDKNCECIIKVAPSCPAGTTISPRRALCTGSREPVCPRGANRVPKKCACVEITGRICPRGTKPSRNRCSCVSTVKTQPKCFRGCFLNSKTCTCRHRIACYVGNACRGPYTPLNSAKECCAVVGLSYKTLANGRCTQCPRGPRRG